MRTRGADLVAKSLESAGQTTLFTLSGNHVMPIFDAVLDTGLRLVHVRHEASAVHMADAWARATGQCGVALVTGGAGHTNAVAALPTALAAESPVVLLSGHAPLGELGRGSFQELPQADLARPLTKASWTASSARTLGDDLAKAFRIARSGRPGPVHLSLPVDLLDEEIPASDFRPPAADAFEPAKMPAGRPQLEEVIAALDAAERPLILAGPRFCRGEGAEALARLAAASNIPAIGMESPRGINDPSLGDFAAMLARADLLLLLGKPHDFTLRFADPPVVHKNCAIAVIDDDAALVDRVRAEKKSRLAVAVIADPLDAARDMAGLARGRGDEAWKRQVDDAIAYRPPAWADMRARERDTVHPLELCRALEKCLEHHPDATLVCDGGEIGQWPQTIARKGRRIINGVAGSIGAGVPFAVGARAATAGPVIAVMGDGSFGFHLAEFDTAIRCDLPVVVVVGNDATWNAEHQIQLRSYGPERARGCDLLPTRYDRVIEAFGGYGEHVTSADQLESALQRALASGRPACINVAIERVAAPVIRRSD